MPKVFTSKSQKVGELGESLAEKYLVGKGYKIIERNYTISQGEIDIVAKSGDSIVFVEVKAVSVSSEYFNMLTKTGNTKREVSIAKTLQNKGNTANTVPHETNNNVTHVTNQTNSHQTGVKTDQFHKGHEIQIRPEDNLHPRKLQKLYRTIEIYLSDKSVLYNKKWRIDLLCVFLDIHSKQARVVQYENVNI